MARLHARPRGHEAGAALSLAAAFVAVHVWLAFVGLSHPSGPFQDVTVVYSTWIQRGLVDNNWVVIDGSWVYPFAALAPMLAAATFGFEWYGITWLLLVTLLDAAALGILTEWGARRDRLALGWWWTAFLALLGPVALGRIDSVTVPIAIVAVTIAYSRPRFASALLTVAAWMKIWPGAVVLALVVGARARSRVALVAAVTTTAIVGVALFLGSGGRVLSFFSEQADRGIQIESVIGLPWMWLVAARVPGTTAYYDQAILTYQVTGPGTDVAAAVMTPALVLVVLAILSLGVLAARRGASETRVVPSLALALVAALIVVNKVGSPQFMVWFVAPVIMGLLVSRSGTASSYRTPAVLVLLLAALTQLVYPYLYGNLVDGHPAMVLALTVRNGLVMLLGGWAVRELVRLVRGTGKLETTMRRVG